MFTRTSLFSCAALLLLGGQALAQKELPPEGGQPKDFTLPDRQTMTLDNGFSATMIPYGAVPKAVIRLVVRTGNIHESSDQVWLADLMGDYLKEGTTTRSSQEVARLAASMGGSVNVNVSEDQTSVSGSVLSEFAPAMISLLADVLRNPAFPASELERLKNDRVRQLSIAKTDPQSLALEKFRAVLYPDHPYGRIFPTEPMIKGYTLEHVKEFYATNVGAARTRLYVAGVFDTDDVEEAIRNAFTDWQRGPESALNIPKPISERRIHIVNRPGVPQSTIYLGLPVIDPSHADYKKLLVTNALLGGSFASRITSNIRENKGYTYSPTSVLSTRYRDAYWSEVASVGTPVTGASLKEIFYEIDRLQGEPPTAEELKGIQNYVAGVFVLQNSTPVGIINQVSFLDLHQLPDTYLTEFVKDVHAVTPDDIQHMTRTYLDDNQMAIVIAGDRKAIENQVAPYGRIVR